MILADNFFPANKQKAKYVIFAVFRLNWRTQEEKLHLRDPSGWAALD